MSATLRTNGRPRGDPFRNQIQPDVFDVERSPPVARQLD